MNPIELSAEQLLLVVGGDLTEGRLWRKQQSGAIKSLLV